MQPETLTLDQAENGVETSTPLPTTTKPKPPKSLGRPEFDLAGLVEFQGKPIEKQKEILKDSWTDAAFVLVNRLKRFGMTVTSKDFGRLQQLATSAGVAFDKVFPKNEQVGAPINGNVIFNLFGSLGGERVMKILQPTLPHKEHINGNPGADRSPHGTSESEDRINR